MAYTLSGKLNIRNCILGNNLNMSVIRGYAELDALARISGADVFDQIENKFGTQRELKPKHAKDAGDYAMKSKLIPATDDPRAFTEIILNVRDMNVVNIKSNGRQFDLKSFEQVPDDEVIHVDIEISLDRLNIPAAKFAPQISRVDGNHRLSAIDSSFEAQDSEYPLVPFAMFIGLTKDQERKLFRDINGKQEKMVTAHLSQIQISLEGDNAILDPSSRSLWIAKRISSAGWVFENMVFEGGSKTGLKQELGSIPPISLTSLDSMVRTTLRGIEPYLLELFPDQLVNDAKQGDEESLSELVAKGEKLAKILNMFWLSIRTEFIEAWQDKKNHILLQSIGLNGTSKFAADLIRELVQENKVNQPSFDLEVKKLKAAGFDYSKSKYEGFAGAAGAQKIWEIMTEKKIAGGDTITAVLENL